MPHLRRRVLHVGPGHLQPSGVAGAKAAPVGGWTSTWSVVSGSLLAKIKKRELAVGPDVFLRFDDLLAMERLLRGLQLPGAYPAGPLDIDYEQQQPANG